MCGIIPPRPSTAPQSLPSYVRMIPPRERPGAAEGASGRTDCLTRDSLVQRMAATRAEPLPLASPELLASLERNKQEFGQGEARSQARGPVRGRCQAAGQVLLGVKYWHSAASNPPTRRLRSRPAWPSGGACACLLRASAQPPGRASRRSPWACRTAAATTQRRTCGECQRSSPRNIARYRASGTAANPAHRAPNSSIRPRIPLLVTQVGRPCWRWGCFGQTRLRGCRCSQLQTPGAMGALERHAHGCYCQHRAN